MSKTLFRAMGSVPATSDPQSMNSLLFLGAHMVGDFILQTHKVSCDKLRDWRVRFWHVTLYCLPFTILAGAYILADRLTEFDAFFFLTLVWVTHFITDSRRWASDKEWKPKPILVDQAIHVITLGVLQACFSL